MSQDLELRREKAEIRKSFRKTRAIFKSWQKTINETERSQSKTAKDFDKWHKRLKKREKIAPQNYTLFILMRRATQSGIISSLLVDFILYLLDITEELAVYETELDHDQDKLTKRLTERKKLELRVPPVIGRE